MFNFPAAFDRPTFKRMERNAQENTTQAAICLRVALTLMTRSSVQLRASVVKNLETAEALLSTAEGLREAIEWHEAEIKLLRTAEARLLTVLSDAYPVAALDETQEACDIAVQLARSERAVLEALALSHGRTLESEASGILAAELRRMAGKHGQVEEGSS
jgi:hypothetical protein